MQENNNGKPSQGGLSWTTPAQSPMPAQKPAAPPKAQVMPAKPASSSTKYAGMIVLGVIAGVIIAWGWSALNAPKESALTSANTNPPAETSGRLVETDERFLGSPQAAGNSVSVATAAISSPTWIVVYENNNGNPGNALGAALFFPGNQGGTVELLRGTTAGKSYLVTLQTDNGDRKFSLKDDQFLLSADGAPQWVTFEVK